MWFSQMWLSKIGFLVFFFPPSFWQAFWQAFWRQLWWESWRQLWRKFDATPYACESAIFRKIQTSRPGQVRKSNGSRHCRRPPGGMDRLSRKSDERKHSIDHMCWALSFVPLGSCQARICFASYFFLLRFFLNTFFSMTEQTCQ